MNVLSFNGKPYKYESYWRNSRQTVIKDVEGKHLKWPKEGHEWPNKNIFLDNLNQLNDYVKRKNNFIPYDQPKDCKICNHKNVSTGLLTLNKMRWEDGLYHYIKEHNIKPSDEFIDFVYRFQNKKVEMKRLTVMKGQHVKKFGKMNLKLDRNQIMIMDALMKHGSKRHYKDTKNQNLFRYSEHAGLIDFNDNGVEKIIVSGKTNRVDEGDKDIFLPSNMLEAFDFEYIFHTHPATPRPGGRVLDGILYEFPSISDLFHFIDHYNMGSTQGSIVLAAEGMYIIRKHKVDNKALDIDDDKFFPAIRGAIHSCQDDAIDKYGDDFTNAEFYGNIASNTEYINRINKVLNRFDLHIDYYPRIKDDKGHWIVDSVYLPVYVIESVE